MGYLNGESTLMKFGRHANLKQSEEIDIFERGNRAIKNLKKFKNKC